MPPWRKCVSSNARGGVLLMIQSGETGACKISPDIPCIPLPEHPGVSHLLHTKQLRHLRALLDKLGNVEREVLDRLINLNVVLPGGGRPDAVMAFLKPSQQPHPRLRVGATPVRAHALFPEIPQGLLPMVVKEGPTELTVR